MTIKTILAAIIVTLSLTIFCAPRPAEKGCSSSHHSIPHPTPKHHYHHGSHYDYISSSILGGAILGSTLINAYSHPSTVVLVPKPVVNVPVVVEQPVVIQQTSTIIAPKVKVWIPSRFIDQVQPNGVVIRVWQEGHYEWK